MAGFAQPINLRAMGFCGIDDSCSPELLLLLSAHYSWIEWGVLFRPDLEGTPRYASPAWLQTLVETNKQGGHIMRLAAHLCQSRCQEALEGDANFIASLKEMGFARVQINATAGMRLPVCLCDSHLAYEPALYFTQPIVFSWIPQRLMSTSRI
jgi:hypothetical protein